MIKEIPVEVIKEVEIIKEVPVEIVKEVEVVKSIDFDSLQKMMAEMGTVEVSRTTKEVANKKKASTKKKTTTKRKAAPKKKASPSAKKATAKKKAPVARAKKDDLKKVEGIGPKIEQLLNKAKIKTFKQLSVTKVGDLRAILAKAGPRFQMHKPDTWARQAGMADKGQWERLQKWQDELNGGKK